MKLTIAEPKIKYIWYRESLSELYMLREIVEEIVLIGGLPVAALCTTASFQKGGGGGEYEFMEGPDRTGVLKGIQKNAKR